MWQHIKELVPLGQTILWVGLIVWVIRKYGGFIDQVLELFRKRVESGSSVKVGNFEIGEAVKPQSLSDQKKEADDDIRESSESTENYEALSSTVKASIRHDYFLTEDLALRAVQEYYGESIQRNVKVLSLFEADGVFTKNGTLHVVEVKAVPVSKIKSIAAKTLTRLDRLISGQAWRNVIIVFVIVIRESDSDNSNSPPADISLDNYQTNIDVHTYLESELKAAFDID